MKVTDEESLNFGEISPSLVSYVTLGSVFLSLNPSFLLCTIQLFSMMSRVILLP